MELRLESLKEEIAAVSLSIESQISVLNSYVEKAKREALSKTLAAQTGINGSSERVLGESESKMRRQAAMISK
jgi:hypothetical protein